MISLRRIAVVLLFAALAACVQLPSRPSLPSEVTIALGEDTPLDRLIAPAEAKHSGEAAFRLVSDGPEAFAIRARSAMLAGRSLDVQTYIWHGDLTGAFLALRLLEAADRGVQVRLLVDDIDARAKNDGFAALDAHPNIAVRVFNPFASRRGKLRMVGEGVRSFGRINQRMHNKSWIADNRIAIVGGRNLGDEYFDASEQMNFVDLDFAMVGPIVRDASASFDKYWNAPSAYPIELLDAGRVNMDALESVRGKLTAHATEAQASRYAAELRADDAIARLLTGDWPMEWSSHYRFAADDPLKAAMADDDPQRSQVLAALLPVVEAAKSDLTIISPYFVPRERGTEKLVGAARGGANVRILTNSLVATDVAAVHGGYSRYRSELLAGGVQLWELKPLPGEKSPSSVFGSSGASLHTKALAADGRTLFVGSYNLDPRSTWLNCEQGVLVENAVLVTQLEAIFAGQTAGARAWHVTLENGHPAWSDGVENFDKDPKASAGRRFQAWLARTLHLDAQL